MLSVAQAARRKPCDRRTVLKAIERGDLKLYKGKLREADVDAWTPKRTRPRVADVEAAERAATEAAERAAVGEEAGDVVTPLTPAQRLKLIELERAEQAWARDRGALVDREQVDAYLVDLGHRIRRDMQLFPRRMQDELVRRLACRKCGGPVDGRIVALEAERCVDDFLRELVVSLPRP